MSAFMDFRCEGCGRRFGQLVRAETKVVLCPKCGREIDLVALNEIIEEARRSILDIVPRATRAKQKGNRQKPGEDSGKHGEEAGS